MITANRTPHLLLLPPIAEVHAVDFNAFRGGVRVPCAAIARQTVGCPGPCRVRCPHASDRHRGALVHSQWMPISIVSCR
jgi:hypothetical protein